MRNFTGLNNGDKFLFSEFDPESYLTEAMYYSKIFFEVDSDFLMDNWDKLSKYGEIVENPNDPLQYILTVKSKADEKKALKLLPDVAVEDIHRL